MNGNEQSIPSYPTSHSHRPSLPHTPNGLQSYGQEEEENDTAASTIEVGSIIASAIATVATMTDVVIFDENLILDLVDVWNLVP